MTKRSQMQLRPQGGYRYGVRPSSGAATTDAFSASELSGARGFPDVAVPEDE